MIEYEIFVIINRGIMILPTPQNLCAILTLFNPDLNFSERIQIISKQIYHIVIINNNPILNISEVLDKININTQIDIINNAANLGVAKALNQGIEYAKSINCEWVLLFDQDTKIKTNFVDIMSTAFRDMKEKDKVGIIAPSYLDEARTDNSSYGHSEEFHIREVRSVITSGSLLSINLYDQLGPFKTELFIDYVDIDYCLRLRARGFKIFKIDTPLMEHKIGSESYHKLLWKRTGTSNHPPIRRYFMMRNMILIAKEYFFVDPCWVIHLLYIRVKSTLLMCLFEKNSISKLKYSGMGFYDGIFTNYNRIVS